MRFDRIEADWTAVGQGMSCLPLAGLAFDTLTILCGYMDHPISLMQSDSQSCSTIN
jgi:hypothetical protein